MMLQVLLMEVAHGLPLPVEALPRYLSKRERLLQDVVAELRPLLTARWIALMSVVWEHWLHPLLYNAEEKYTMFQRTVPVLPKAQLTRMLPALFIPALIIVVPVPAAVPRLRKDCALPF